MLLPALLLISLAGAPQDGARREVVPPELRQELDTEFEALEKELTRASLEWRRALRAARKEGTEYDAPDPTIAFFPRFQGLARRGSPRALLWVGVESDEAGLERDELVTVKREAFGELVRGYAADPLMEDLVKRVRRQVEWLGTGPVAGWLQAVYERNEDVELRARAAFELVQTLAGSPEEEDRDAAEAWCHRIVAEFPDGRMAARAQEQLDTLKYQVGRVAPDFTTADVDGNAFRLSDYRGKVVVLDFWGFW